MNCRVRASWRVSASKKGEAHPHVPTPTPGFGMPRAATPGYVHNVERYFPVRGLIEGAEAVAMAETVQEVAEMVEVTEAAVGEMEAVAKMMEYGDAAVSEGVPALPSEILDEPILEDVALEENTEEDVLGSKRTFSLIILNVMTLLMASNGVAVKSAEALVDPFTFSALRFFVCSLTFVPFLMTLSPGVLDKKSIRAGLEFGFWSTLGYLFQTIGLEHTDASKAGFLGGLFVVIVPILAGLSGKGISKFTWAGAALTIFGTSLLEGGSTSAFGLGDIYCVLSATFFSIQMLRAETFMRSLPSGSSLPILCVATLTTSVVSAGLVTGTHPTETLSFLNGLFTHNLDIQNITTYFHGLPWMEILYTGIFSTALVLFIELMVLENVTSTDAAIVYSIQPVFAGILAFIFLGEHWTPIACVGAAVIVGASIGTQLLNSSSEGDPDGHVQMAKSD